MMLDTHLDYSVYCDLSCHANSYNYHESVFAYILTGRTVTMTIITLLKGNVVLGTKILGCVWLKIQ